MSEPNPSKNTTKEYSYFLYDPELKKRHEKALPTKEMYRFFPTYEDVIRIEKDDPKKNYRYIFSSNNFCKTPYEEQKLKKFYEYIEKNNFTLPIWWLESDTMRFLQACEFDIKKAFDTIKGNIEWLRAIPKEMDKKIITLANSGFLYIFGRDCHFRPIMIVEAEIAVNLLNGGYSVDELEQSIRLIMNYMINYLLIPGQIENMVVITDLNGIGLGQMLKFKNILSSLNKYRGRVFRNHMINLGNGMSGFLKSIINTFGGAASARKLMFLSKDELNKIQELIRPDNLEKKFGGNVENVVYGNNNLFPPVFPSDKYTKNDEILNIVSENEYKEMCLNSKPFKPFVISDKFIKIWEEEENEKKLKKKKSNNIYNSIKTSVKTISIMRYNLENEDEINNFIAQFECMERVRNTKNRIKNYIPRKINVNEIKNFFNGFK